MNSTRFIITFFLICFCFGGFLSSVPLFAQSSNETTNPALMTEGPVSSALIVGYVIDEDGKPVPNATVSLWQDGRLWQTNRVYAGSMNPQQSGASYCNESIRKEGGFFFGAVSPGEYILKAEKDRYNSSVSVRVSNDTLSQNMLNLEEHVVMVNITLNGYHVPTLTPSQRANTGAITGSVWNSNGDKVYGIVSLWQDGMPVELPDNPQCDVTRDYSGKNVDYVFEHLAQGRYTVMVEYYVGPVKCNDTIPVDVGTGRTTADILVSEQFPKPPKATPSLPGIFVPIIMGIIAYFSHEKKYKK